MENLKLAAASILGLLLVLMPMIIGNHISQFGWGFCFSVIELLAIVMFYECGYYDGTLDKRLIGNEASSRILGKTRYKDNVIPLNPIRP